MRTYITILVLLCSLLPGVPTIGENPQKKEKSVVVNLGTRVEMFVDDWLIERKKSVSLRLTPPEKREIVLSTDQPWEGPASAYFTVIQDGKNIRLYYRGLTPDDASKEQVTCMVESEDGIHFTRPNLGLFTFQRSKKNNIVWQGVESHNFAPFLDTNPNAKPEERYKALGGIDSKLFAFVSPDGVHWKKMQETPVMTEGAFDSLNVAFWDETSNLYRCYSRYWTGGGYQGLRAIQHCTSPDFQQWSKPEPNHYTSGPQKEHFYTNATRPCPDAPHFFLSFPKRFIPDRKKVTEHKDAGVSDALFMSSRDGTTWDRTFQEAWVRPGRDPHNWTQRSNMTACGIIQTAPDEFSLYITEHYGWPDHRLRRLTVRKHGFASVHADYREGEFVTRPLTFSGKRLLLNAATSSAGSIRVEVQDETGKPLPGFTLRDSLPFYGDELEAVAAWKSGSDLASLTGKTIRLRFVLQDADLYALRFAP